MKPTKLPRVLIVLTALLMTALLAACSAGSPTYEYGAPDRAEGGAPAGGEPQQAPQGTYAPQAPQAPQDDGERMIIRTQTLRLEVDSTLDTVTAIRELADAHSAVVSNMRMASDDGWVYDSPAGTGVGLRGWLTVRVPVDAADAFTKQVADLGKLVYQAETSDDVTQEHVDLSARLENLRAQEVRLRELVAQATNVEEVLTVEQELWRIRGEIESLDAQIAYLERQAAMATVTIELAEDGPVVQSWGFWEALRSGVRAAASVLSFLVSFLIASSPLWLLGLGIFFIVRTIRRRRRLARGETEPAPRARKRKPASYADLQPEPVEVGTTEPSTDAAEADQGEGGATRV